MKKKYLLIIIAVCFLSGCIVRFVYNQLDWIIPWYIGQMISLHDDQASELEKRLISQLKWHRTTQLPAYSKSLNEIGKAVKTDLTIAHLDQFHLTMRHYWQDLVRHIGPDLAKILSTATDEQIDELMRNLKKRNQKFREDYIDLPEEELRENKQNRMTRFLKYCMGDLNEQQEKIVKQWSHDLKDIGIARLEYIKLGQEKFKQIVKRRKDLVWFEKELCDLLYFDRETWPEEFRKIAEHNRELTKRVFIQIHQNMSEDQKKDFFENALSLSNELHELSKEI
ncbi:MAG: hypothetical protein C4522_07640 [Desulfobacteraceae bacterium]|nr:MAG: hypothetical protein C4522_07640 [Desulfobacteraceae bacterium]